jgi:hypothetical protein
MGWKSSRQLRPVLLFSSPLRGQGVCPIVDENEMEGVTDRVFANVLVPMR